MPIVSYRFVLAVGHGYKHEKKENINGFHCSDICTQPFAYGRL
jgi:hypothetical protein